MGNALAAAEAALASLAAGNVLGVRQSIEALALCVEVLREGVGVAAADGERGEEQVG